MSSRRRVSRRQLIFGTVMLPISLLPFVAYGNLTPEGRLIRDRAVVAVAPPNLPTLSARDREEIAAIAPRYAGAVMALVYHGVGDVGGGAEGEGDYTIDPERFGEHLVALEAAGLAPVTAADVADAFAGRGTLPPNAVMISFDDGRSDAMLWATPLLEEAHAVATMFVISSAAATGGAYYAGWDELRAHVEARTWDVQAHTDDLHRMQMTSEGELPALTSLADGETIDEYRARIRTDLERSSDTIEEATGVRPRAFAYPFGAYGADRSNDPRIAAILEQEVAARYEIAFQQDGQDDIALAGCGDERLQLRRLDVKGWTGPELIQRIAEAGARFDTGRRCPLTQSVDEAGLRR